MFNAFRSRTSFWALRRPGAMPPEDLLSSDAEKQRTKFSAAKRHGQRQILRHPTGVNQALAINILRGTLQ